MFGMNVVTEPQIDPIVSDFPIFPALGNGGAQSVDYGSENRQNWFFCPSISWVGAHMNTIGDQLFQDIPRRVANFRENRPTDVEKSADGKNNTTKT